jgi:DNA-binding beta-propeller fold protein YncE
MTSASHSHTACRDAGLPPATRARQWHAAAAALAVGAGLLLSGCSGSKPASTAAQSTAAQVWPPAPETARIAYVGSVHRPADMGVKRSAFVRFGQWLTGSEKGNEPLRKPFGIALDEEDNLLLTDTGDNAVCYYHRASRKWSRYDKVGKVRFVSPVAVAKLKGVFYVADTGRGSVVAFDEAGKFLFETSDHLKRPSGLTISGDRLVVADSQRHCIVQLDLAGRFLSEFGRRGKGKGEFNFPTHVAADREGKLYVTDSMNSRIQILDKEGVCQGEVGSLGDSPGNFGRPKGVSVDAHGHIYAIDALFDNIQIFDRTGRLLLNLGASGSQPGEFWLPNGIAITRDNEIYATDTYNHRVQVFKYVGPS